MKQEVIRRLEATRGDDLIRARKSFANTDLSEQWGQSGKTKQEILDSWQERDDKLTACIDWVKSL